jgi:hypothetical protein
VINKIAKNAFLENGNVKAPVKTRATEKNKLPIETLLSVKYFGTIGCVSLSIMQ